MRYCSVVDVRNVLAPSDSTAGSAATLSDDQMWVAVEDASSRVFTQLGHLYVLADPPEGQAEYPVRSWTADIAAYLATLTYKKNADVPADDPARLRYEHALAQIELIASGAAVLYGFPKVAEQDGGVGFGTVHNQYQGQLFGPGDFSLVYDPSAAVLPWGV